MIAALDASDRALWATAFYAGLRRGELIALRREDVDLVKGVLHVRRSWDLVEGRAVPTKNSKEQTVQIAAVLRRHLPQQILASENPSHLFGRPQNVARAGRRSRELWEAAGLPVVLMHGARHAFASFAIAAGANVKALSTFGAGLVLVVYMLLVSVGVAVAVSAATVALLAIAFSAVDREPL